MGTYIKTSETSNPFISAVTISQLSASTITNNLQDAYNRFWSAGIYNGAEYVNNGDGTVTISEGEGVLRVSASSNSQLVAIYIPQSTPIEIQPGQVNYIYADYNNGNCFYTASTNVLEFNCQDKCLVYTIYRSLSSNSLDVVDGRAMNEDHNTKHRRKLLNTQLFEYGLNPPIFSAITGLDFFINESSAWYGLNKIDLNSFTSSNEDVLTSYYSDGLGSFVSITATTIDNLYYDNNTGTLQDIPAGKYANRWVYQTINDQGGNISFVYGKAVYENRLNAINERIPSNLPNKLNGFGKLVAQLIVRPDISNYAYIKNLAKSESLTIPDINHNELLNIQGGSSNELYHLRQSEHSYLTNFVEGTVSSETIFEQNLSAGTNFHVAKNAHFSTNNFNISTSPYIIDCSMGSLQLFNVNSASVLLQYNNALPGTYVFVFTNQIATSFQLRTSSGWFTPNGQAASYNNNLNAVNVITCIYDGSKMLVMSTSNYLQV